jgi:hypothetical protein
MNGSLAAEAMAGATSLLEIVNRKFLQSIGLWTGLRQADFRRA